MSCTSVSIQGAAGNVQISNLGFGTVTGRFPSCNLGSDVVGKDIYVWFDYSGTGLWDTLHFDVYFEDPSGTTRGYHYDEDVSSLIGVLGVRVPMKYQPGSYTNLRIDNLQVTD